MRELYSDLPFLDKFCDCSDSHFGNYWSNYNLHDFSSTRQTKNIQ